MLDFGRTDDQRLFFAMEFLEGETLTKVVEREKQLAVDARVDILSQMGEALIEAHGLGYVHRDLRPRNVFLVNRRGRADFVKLLDFGLAKLILPDAEAKQTAMGMTFGDPRYMSPEQARGETLDRRADIYSLGAIAFEMLTGVAAVPAARARSRSCSSTSTRRCRRCATAAATARRGSTPLVQQRAGKKPDALRHGAQVPRAPREPKRRRGRRRRRPARRRRRAGAGAVDGSDGAAPRRRRRPPRRRARRRSKRRRR